MLAKAKPEVAQRLLQQAEAGIAARWSLYEQLAAMTYTSPGSAAAEQPATATT